MWLSCINSSRENQGVLQQEHVLNIFMGSPIEVEFWMLKPVIEIAIFIPKNFIVLWMNTVMFRMYDYSRRR